MTGTIPALISSTPPIQPPTAGKPCRKVTNLKSKAHYRTVSETLEERLRTLTAEVRELRRQIEDGQSRIRLASRTNDAPPKDRKRALPTRSARKTR